MRGMHLAVVLASAQLVSAADATLPSRRQIERKATSKGVWIGAAVGAPISQAENSPSEWGTGWEGFGKRFASSFAKGALKNVIKVTVGTIRHEELNYKPSGKQGFKPRVTYALLSTVVTRRTTTGKKTVASGEITGTVGAGFISRLWQPASLRTVGSGIGSVGVSFAADAGLNVTREFWPEIRHPKKARAQKRSMEH